MSEKNQLPELKYEDVLEPELPICDAHHHLWEYPGSTYLGKEFIKDVDGNNVVQTVFVETWARNLRTGGTVKEPADQTALAVAEGNSNPGKMKIAAGIIGYADPTAGKEVEKVIESHIIAGQGKFRGIRLFDCDINDNKFLEVFSVINKQKLVIEFAMRYDRLIDIVGFATEYPEIPLIINHLGLTFMKPGEVVYDDIEHWKEIMTEIAAYENLYMKLGGLGMDLKNAGWEKSDYPDSTELAQVMKPWFFHCIEKFGVKRCMFQSNFPVDNKSYSYTVYWNAAKRLTNTFSTSERNSLFYSTAVKAFRLD